VETSQRRGPLLAVAQRESHAHPVGQQAARHERQYLLGHPVHPLRVVYDTQHRLLFRRPGQQCQSRQADQERARSLTVRQPEHRFERAALRDGQVRQPAEKRDQQLVQPGEVKPRLGLGAGGLREARSRVRGSLGRLAQQRRLPDPRLAPQHQDRTRSSPRIVKEGLEDAQLSRPADQRHVRGPFRWASDNT
jgi:hypothetical protein